MGNSQQPMATGARLIAGPEVQARTSLSRCTIWRLVRAGRFPAPVQISAQRVAWSVAAVDAWIDARLAEAGQGVGG